MDSLSQLALGAAVGVAVMGRRSAVWKAALWGGVCGTLPDLDAFIDHGDPVSNMTLHRTESHALFYLTLLAPVLAAGIAKLHGELDRYRHWLLAVWLALVTHPLLDVMTVYGTQLGLPFTDHPFGVGSIFIIDPLYTLPLLVGVIVALRAAPVRGLRWNAAGLALSTVYLGWSVLAQQHITAAARAALQADGVTVERLLVTPTPFNTVLWRVVAVTPDGYREGFRSLLDRTPQIAFDTFPRGGALYEPLREHAPVARMAWFSRGFFKMAEQDGQVRLSDLRMGQEPFYTFSFDVATRRGDALLPTAPRQHAWDRPDIGAALRWLARRSVDEQLPPRR
jgi:inner membrane protein